MPLGGRLLSFGHFRGMSEANKHSRHSKSCHHAISGIDCPLSHCPHIHMSGQRGRYPGTVHLVIGDWWRLLSMGLSVDGESPCDPHQSPKRASPLVFTGPVPCFPSPTHVPQGPSSPKCTNPPKDPHYLQWLRMGSCDGDIGEKNAMSVRPTLYGAQELLKQPFQGLIRRLKFRHECLAQVAQGKVSYLKMSKQYLPVLDS